MYEVGPELQKSLLDSHVYSNVSMELRTIVLNLVSRSLSKQKNTQNPEEHLYNIRKHHKYNLLICQREKEERENISIYQMLFFLLFQ